MISVPVGTGDIADAMISASQMIYASRMKERILFHACKASISCGGEPYIILRQQYYIKFRPSEKTKNAKKVVDKWRMVWYYLGVVRTQLL